MSHIALYLFGIICFLILFDVVTGEFGAVKFKMPEDGILKMSYIEQARKREKCYRLSW